MLQMCEISCPWLLKGAQGWLFTAPRGIFLEEGLKLCELDVDREIWTPNVEQEEWREAVEQLKVPAWHCWQTSLDEEKHRVIIQKIILNPIPSSKLSRRRWLKCSYLLQGNFLFLTLVSGESGSDSVLRVARSTWSCDLSYKSANMLSRYMLWKKVKGREKKSNFGAH